jgi:hypothetical protein
MTALAGEAGAIDDVYIALGTTIKSPAPEAALFAPSISISWSPSRAAHAEAQPAAAGGRLGARRRSP